MQHRDEFPGITKESLKSHIGNMKGKTFIFSSLNNQGIISLKKLSEHWQTGTKTTTFELIQDSLKYYPSFETLYDKIFKTTFADTIVPSVKQHPLDEFIQQAAKFRRTP